MFLNTIVEKKHTLNPEINLLYQLHAQKANAIVWLWFYTNQRQSTFLTRLNVVCKKMPSVMSMAFRRGFSYQIGWIFGKKSKHAFFKVCLVLIFLNTIVEKKHTLNPEITLLYQFHAQKALFKGPKICNIIFWIENVPPPLWNFSKNSSDLVAGPFP